MEKLRIAIASLPDREQLVAEIFYEGIEWVEISQETGGLIIQFYPHPRKELWEFSLDEALGALEELKRNFLG